MINGTWRHVAVTWDQATRTLRFFLDGVQFGSQVRTEDFSAATSSAFGIGCFPTALGDNNFRDMTIDELRITARRLEAKELLSAARQSFHTGLPPFSDRPRYTSTGDFTALGAGRTFYLAGDASGAIYRRDVGDASWRKVEQHTRRPGRPAAEPRFQRRFVPPMWARGARSWTSVRLYGRQRNLDGHARRGRPVKREKTWDKTKNILPFRQDAFQMEPGNRLPFGSSVVSVTCFLYTNETDSAS